MAILRKYQLGTGEGGLTPEKPEFNYDESYRNKIYGTGAAARHYNDLSEGKRRFLDYKYGFQGNRDVNGNIVYTRETKNPGFNYYGTRSIDNNRRQEGNNMAGTHQSGTKWSSYTDPWTKEKWSIPTSYLGKSYPDATSGESIMKKKGGLLYKAGKGA